MEYTHLESPGTNIPLGEAFFAVAQIIEKQNNAKKQHDDQEYMFSEAESELITYLKDNIGVAKNAVSMQEKNPHTIFAIVKLEEMIQWYAPLVPNIKELMVHQPLYFQYLKNTLANLLGFVKDIEQKKVMPGSVRDYYQKQFEVYAKELLRTHDL